MLTSSIEKAARSGFIQFPNMEVQSSSSRSLLRQERFCLFTGRPSLPNPITCPILQPGWRNKRDKAKVLETKTSRSTGQVSCPQILRTGVDQKLYSSEKSFDHGNCLIDYNVACCLFAIVVVFVVVVVGQNPQTLYFQEKLKRRLAKIP